jgi:hypothetical protein
MQFIVTGVDTGRFPEILLIEDWFIYFCYKDLVYSVCFELSPEEINKDNALSYVLRNRDNWKKETWNAELKQITGLNDNTQLTLKDWKYITNQGNNIL